MKTKFVSLFIILSLAQVGCQSTGGSGPKAAVACSGCKTVWVQHARTGYAGGADAKGPYTSMTASGHMKCPDCENRLEPYFKGLSTTKHVCKSCAAFLRSRNTPNIAPPSCPRLMAASSLVNSGGLIFSGDFSRHAAHGVPATVGVGTPETPSLSLVVRVQDAPKIAKPTAASPANLRISQGRISFKTETAHPLERWQVHQRKSPAARRRFANTPRLSPPSRHADRRRRWSR